MKFLLSVPSSLERCQGVHRLILRALQGGGIPLAHSPSPAARDRDGAALPLPAAPRDDEEAKSTESVFIGTDPPEKHLGSGGGTIHLLHRCFDEETRRDPPVQGAHATDDAFWSWLAQDRRVILHAGGQSRRLPSYASVGKILTPLPCFFPTSDDNAAMSDSMHDGAPSSPSVNQRGGSGGGGEDAAITPHSFLASSPPVSSTSTAGVAMPQRVDETVLSLQVHFLEQALRRTPRHLRTVIHCGDVCLTAPVGALPDVRGPAHDRNRVAPQNTTSPTSTAAELDANEEASGVDVLCYGLRPTDAQQLGRHGVFVVDPTQGNTLRCMLQKPTREALEMAVSPEITAAQEPPLPPPRHKPHHQTTRHRALLDVGVWMLSDRAVLCLRDQCCRRTQDDSATLGAYDLFADFGALLGEAPSQPQTANAASSRCPVSSLRVKVVDLTDADVHFHHVGTTPELLDATAALANRLAPGSSSGARPAYTPLYEDSAGTSDSPPALLHLADVERRVFVQHARVAATVVPAAQTPSSSSSSYVWIENAEIGSGIELSDHHVLTGFPRGNDWRFTLPTGTCVSVVPIRSSPASQDRTTPCRQWAAHVYGFSDRFSGDVRDDATCFLGVPLAQWLRDHHLTFADILPRTDARPAAAGGLESHDIQAARLFPCTASVEVLGQLIAFMAQTTFSPSEASLALATLWRDCPRVSAAELNVITDAAALLAARDVFLAEALPCWLAFDATSQRPRYPPVYDHGDLHAMAMRCADLNVSQPLREPPAPAVTPSLYTARACMLCAQVLRYRGDSAAAAADTWDQHAFLSLQRCMTHAFRDDDVHGIDARTGMDPTNAAARTAWRLPSVAVQADQVVWARSPARVDVCGGWTDTPPFSLFRGGAVVNAAVEMNGQAPIQVYVRLRDTPEIAIRSVDLGLDHVVRTYEDLREYATVGSAFSIPKAALALAGFLPDLFPSHVAQEPAYAFASLQDQLRRTFDGKGLELTVFVAIPAGSGLGTSSIVAGTALSALSEFCGLGWRTEDVCQRVLWLEQLLTTGGGWQDQFGGLYPSIKLVQSDAGVLQRPSVCWLAERVFTAPGCAGCHMLYYTGITRVAKSILTEIVRGMFLNERARVLVLTEMHRNVQRLCAAISYGDIDGLGRLVSKAWEQNKRLDAGTCPPAVQAIMERVLPYARGAKLLGAGGGGFLYILATSESAAQRLREDLTANPPNPRARFVTMRLSDTGIQLGRS